MKFRVSGKSKRVFAWLPVFINVGPNDDGNFAWLEFVWKGYGQEYDGLHYQSDSDYKEVERKVREYHRAV